MKQVTKSYLQNLYDMGFSVKDMKSKIKEDFGAEVTVGYLKLAIKRFGLDLRKKPRRTDVVFVDDTIDNNAEIAVPQVEPAQPAQGYQIKPGHTLVTEGLEAFESGLESASPQTDDLPYTFNV